MSPTQANMLPITAWLHAAATCKELFKKGNPPNLHVDFPASTDQTAIDRWAAMYQAMNLGPRNIGTPVMTKGGGKVTELQRGQLADYFSFLDQKRDEILAGYGVPPAEAGVIESGNLGGGTGESQRKTFLTNTCNPIAELVLEKLNFAIVQRGFLIEGWHLKFEQVDMRDSSVVEQIRDTRLHNGSWTLNRYRADIGEPSVDGGDEAVLVDRQNLVMWADMHAASAAGVAAKLKGSSLDVEEPAPGKPLSLVKQEKPALQPGLIGAPQPGAMPPQLAAHAAAAKAVAGAPAAAPGAPGQPPVPAKAAVKESAGDVIAADWARLSAQWTDEYQRRRRLALAELP